jgi:asparagine synthase (glutamine-hydrolysing)
LSAAVRSTTFVEGYTQLIGYFSVAEVMGLTGQENLRRNFIAKLEELVADAASRGRLATALALDRIGFLAHNLTVTDRSSMLHSVEVRVPLLTRYASEFADSRMDDGLVNLRRGKIPLRQALTRWLPRRLIDRRKVGFNPPLDQRIRKLGPSLLHSVLHEGPLQGRLDQQLIDRLVQDHFSGKTNNTFRLWQLAYLSMWIGWLEGAPGRARSGVAPTIEGGGAVVGGRASDTSLHA